MGLERVTYLDNFFVEHPIIISRVQVFLHNYILKNENEDWLKTITDDLYSNSRLPIIKFFFDEDYLEPFPKRKNYLLKVLDNAYKEMKNMELKDFLMYIYDLSKGTFFEIHIDTSLNNESYNHYINTLKKVMSQIH